MNNRAFLLLFVAVTACSGSSSSSGSSTPSPAPTNEAPMVSAGPDQTVFEGMIVTLAGTVTDPDDTPSISWSQTSGRAVTIDNPDTLNASFKAPSVSADEILAFSLLADDGVNAAVTDEVLVTVRDDGVIVTRISPAGVSYIDPEVHPLRPELVFQANNKVTVAPFDLSTGLLVDGVEPIEIDDVATLTESRNGPEYALDQSGVAITYNKEAADGSLQFFRATEQADGSYAIERITAPGVDRINQLPSQNPDAPTTYLLYGRADSTSPIGEGVISYLDVAEPSMEIDLTPIRAGFSGFRWVRGTSLFLTTISEGSNEGQVLLVNAETGEERVVTNDDGVKFDPYGWFPPEFDGDLAFHAITNGGDITVYRDTGGMFFEVVSVLPPPAETTMTFAQSPEPFVTQSGRSLIGLTLKNDPGGIFDTVTESEIWLYGIADGPDRFTLRCDDREPVERIRHEAEFVSGENQLFVYYNTVSDVGFLELTLCESGLAP